MIKWAPRREDGQVVISCFGRKKNRCKKPKSKEEKKEKKEDREISKRGIKFTG